MARGTGIVFEGNGEETMKFLSDDTNNLLMNMSSGLLPEYLTECEVGMLVSRYGENWFEKLGYSEPEYKKPKFA